MLNPHRLARFILAFLLLVLVPAARAEAPGFGSLLGVRSDLVPVAVAGPAAINGPAGTFANDTAAPVTSPSFITGFNQGWIRNAYGRQWTTAFEEAEVRRLLRATRELGGRVYRIWIFEGIELEGVVWDDQPGKQHTDVRTRPTGIAPEKLANIERMLTIAEEERVQVYLTFFDATIYSGDVDRIPARRRAEWWNLLSEEHGTAAAFLKNVARPVMQVAARHRGAVFGLDLMNEFNGMVKKGGFKGGWPGARSWVQRWRRALREESDIPITASFGYWASVDDLTAWHLTDDDVDFWDFHAYTFTGGVWDEDDLREFLAKTRHKTYLGEFGQVQPWYDDHLQARITERTLRKARSLGLAGAFAWRLSDIRPYENPEARFSYEAYGKWRPAAEVFKRLSAEFNR